MKKVRTFTAVAFPEELRKDLADIGTNVFAGLKGVRWVKEKALHLTLKFLGDVPMDDTAAISDAIRGVISGIEPFEIKVGGSGAFPSKSRPRIIWVGVSEETGRLEKLFNAIDKAMVSFGIAREKKRYHPHVTIGRVKGRLDSERFMPGMDELNEIDYGTLEVNGVTFFMSDLTPQGPVYTTLATIPL
ncbi:MAG: RNA 2',3'-cyclic phosphodiesterase [Planctomycetota bacterium]